MSSDTDNPYAAPLSATAVNGRRSSWSIAVAGVCRVALAGVSFLIGATSLLLGAYGLTGIGWLMATEPITSIRDFMVAGCSLFLGLGTAWIIAGWYYWKRRYRCAVIATGVGVLICVVVIGIMEFSRHG